MSKMSKVAKASIMLIVGTVFSKMLGFARELLVAYRFGAGSISDAFILTNGIPTILFSALGVAININFIPFYHRIETNEQRDRFTSNLTNISLIVMLLGCILIDLFPGLFLKLFGAGLPLETEQYAIVMLRIVAFSIFPIMLSHIFQAYLQANECFAATALYGILTNIAVIFFALIASRERFYILSVGTILSHVIGLIPVIYQVKKCTKFHYITYVKFNDKLIKNIVLLTLPLLMENLASSMSLLVDRNLASFLGAGVISGLSYAGTIGNIASTMIASAIMTTTFPMFSKLLATEKRNLFCEYFAKYAAVISYLLCPISVFLIFNSGDIVKVIFEHGAFNGTATVIVSESMVCYAFGVLPMGLQSYLIRGFYAMQDTKRPVRIKIFALLCNIILNLITVTFIRHKGIALSTSISYVIAYTLLGFELKKRHGIDNIGIITKEATIALIMSIIPAIVLFIIFSSFIVINNVLLKLLIVGIIYILLYISTIYVFRKDRFNDVLKMISRR